MAKLYKEPVLTIYEVADFIVTSGDTDEVNVGDIWGVKIGG